MQIELFCGSQPEFYSIMGKYFAEPQYKKEIPYMVNRETNTWLLGFEKGKLVGFAAINALKDKTILEHSYVLEEYRKSGLWKHLNDERLKIAAIIGCPVEVITKEEYLAKYWVENGFVEYKKNGRYRYFRKDVKKNEASVPMPECQTGSNGKGKGKRIQPK